MISPERRQTVDPQFIADSIPKVSFFDGERRKRYEGSTADVVFLNTLPPNIAEKVDNIEQSDTGYALKQYRHDILSTRHLFAYDGEGHAISAKNIDSLEPHQQAAILQKRQQEIQAYFNEALPDFIVPSHFFIGRNDRDGMVIYELQQRLQNFVHPLSNDQENKAYVETLSDEQKRQLFEEIEKLVRRVIYLYIVDRDAFHGCLPDFHGGNIAFTSDGHIRTFDTNVYRDRGDHIFKQNLNFTLQGLLDMQRILSPGAVIRTQREIIEEYYDTHVFPKQVKDAASDEDE